MKIDCYTDASVFENLKTEWLALLPYSLTNTPFQRPEFQQVWWKHLGRGQLCMVTMREGEKLMALAPLFIDDEKVLRWIGGEEIADYLDLIAPADHMDAVTRALWDYLNSPASPAWAKIILSNIPEWTATPNTLQALAHQANYKAEVTQIDVCPVVNLPDTFEGYLAQIDKKQRHEIKRKLRRADEGEDKVNWYIVDATHNFETEVEAFMTLMAKASPDKERFLTPQMRSTFKEIFVEMNKASLLQLAFLEINGAKSAAYFQFTYAERVWVYNSGFDPDTAGALSPGWVLLAKLIEHAIATKHKVYDFMQGNEIYKYRFGGQDTKVLRLIVEK